jgi:hypothetical protein
MMTRAATSSEGGLDADEQRVFGDDEELVERVGICV